MNTLERKALGALRFNWAPTPDDVWRSSRFHVAGLHSETMQIIRDGMVEAEGSLDSSPIGVVVLGGRGTGKTHLLGSVREQVQAEGGYFFLVSLLDAKAFWQSTVLSMLDGFTREVADRETQLKVLLQRLADVTKAPRTVRRAITGDAPLVRAAVDAFIDLLRKKNQQIGQECQDTARALVLRASDNFQAQDVGHNFLYSNDEEEPGERSAWGMRRGKRSAQEIVRDMSRLLSLTGPTVIAVDQIDLLIAQSNKSGAGDARDEWQESLLIEQIAGGLMALREITRRTLSVVACLELSWDLIVTKATDTVQDRFRVAVPLADIPTAELAQELIAQRFTARFRDVDFTPSYPTWPIRPSAFREAVDFTPRRLLMAIDSHIRSCLLGGEVQELAHLNRYDVSSPVALPVPGPATSTPQTLARLDGRFAALCGEADVGPALDPQTEDAVVPELLSAGLTAWIAEQEGGAEAFGQDPLPGAKPSLHARLRRSFGEDREDEEHWAFRAVVVSHAVSALNKIRTASTAAALTEGVDKRRLFLLRTDDWSPGVKTQEVVSAFEAAGGKKLAFPEEDIKVLMALRELIKDEDPETLQPWFVARKPTREVSFLTAALADATAEGAPPVARTSGESDGGSPGNETAAGPRVTHTGANSIIVGSTVRGELPVRVELEALRKHTAIFAGSGSGKTVLIRRLVEECALRGVSAIVLDPNNDLARLGDPWPEAPAQWGDGDAAKAKEYVDNTDVVVWTPCWEAGRPLSFQPLPDLTGVRDDPDEFRAGVDAAVASLAPRAKVDGAANRAQLGQAVLRETLTSYARGGRSNLREFIALLADLPEGVSALANAERLASDMAQTLTAATVNDPLFGGGGAPVDPGLLLTPPSGKQARVSVISFVGLPSDEQRQSFVNQLQLALFAWIRRNPAGNRPLGGLFVMDEAQTLAPSGAMTACTQSTIVLASQARKYGLGLVFATQSPKGLHNRIPGNAATQLFGLLNAPVQITAAREMARAKGSDVPDISRLGAGQFYAAIEGSAFEKIQAPLCLSHHPKSALTAEEVVARARG
jgi:hypothetical protein